MEKDIPKSKRPYDAVNIRYATKLRIDKIYFKLKCEKGYKSYDDFISDVLDVFEKIK